jgi:hypothetical protein
MLRKALMKINVMWDNTPCRLATSFRHFDLTAAVFLDYLDETINSSETPASRL